MSSEWPSAVTLHSVSGSLELAWDEKEGAVLPGPVLRSACRCAECESLRRKGMAVPVAARLLRVEPVGEKGLQCFFSDGHQRGIYPWTYLRELVLSAV
jgi:DUF971 family protein